MNVIIDATAASSLTTALILIFKFAWPSAQSKYIAGFAFIAGQLSALLVTMAQAGLKLEQAALATMIVTGILATVGAMGLRAGENSADSKRTGPDVEAQRAGDAVVERRAGQ